MPRQRQFQELYIYMNGVRVGILVRESTGSLAFSYADDWLNSENTRPISLSMPLTQVSYKGNLVESFFDNLLPDNETIRKRIQTRFNVPSNNCFDILSYIGADCVGALQLLTQDKLENIQAVHAKPISDSEIAKILKNYQKAPLGMDNKLLDFRISIAGAQEKTALLKYKNKWCLPERFTPTSHIIKLPIGFIKHSGIDLSESVENEWLCLQILSAYSLPVNKADIVLFDDVKTLVVERFDRFWSDDKKWLVRVPQEDFCQVLGYPSALKYESDGGPGIEDVMGILLGSRDMLDDRIKFMKAVFLFWVIGAIDGHAKNFSITIERQGRYQLTPLYDVISAYPIAAKRQLEWQDLKMAMSVKGKKRHYLWDKLLPRYWLEQAYQCQFPAVTMQAIMDEAFDTMDSVIERVENSLPKDFSEQISESIFSGMRKIKNHIL